MMRPASIEIAPPRSPDLLTASMFSLIILVAVIGIPTFAFFYGYSWLDWTMFGFLYVVTGLGITVGYHRLIAHRSFDCPDWVKAGLLIAGGWAFQNTALRWASDHIRHHARCDEVEDPYNAQRGFWYSHCGWLFFKDPHADDKYASRLKNDRILMWQDRYYVPIVLSGLALPFFVGLLYNGWIDGMGCFLLGGIGRMCAVFNSTFCINSICHLWGDQPHSRSDSSRDSWWISLLTFGEGYHNYHHTYPSDYRNGPRWYNFDPSKWVIFLFAKLGLATGLRKQARFDTSADVG